MRTRRCPECDLKFKGRARRLLAATDPYLLVTCPRCGCEWEVELADVAR